MKTKLKRVLVFLLVLSCTISMASAFTPPGLKKKGGLPPGIQKRFINVNLKKDTYETVIREIDVEERRIVIKDGTAFIHFLVAEDAEIKLNDKDSSLKELRVGDQAIIEINSSNTIIEIKATGEARVTPQPVPQPVKVTGVIKTIDLTRKEMVIEGNNATGLYKLYATTVYIDNKVSTLANLKVGMEVTANIDGVNGVQIKTIYAKSQPIKEIKATIKAINLTKREVVLQYDNKEELYVVKADAVIKINGVTQSISALKVGTVADVKIQSGQIIEVLVNNGILQLEGRLMAKYTGTNPTITVEINQELKVFKVKPGISIAHATVGKQVIIYIQDEMVIALQEK